MDCPSLKEIRGASLRGFPVAIGSALAINSTLFQESSTNDLEIAIDSKFLLSTCTQAFHDRDTLHLNLWLLAAGLRYIFF